MRNPFYIKEEGKSMELHSLTDSAHPDAQKAFTSFKSKHGQALSNQVVQRFLNQQANYQLFTTAICFPTEENWERLDWAFRQFYTEIRFINYLSKVIWRYGRDFRSKHQRNEAHYLIILDQPMQKEESSATTYKDQLADNSENDTLKGESFLDQVDDFYLQEALKQLTDKQLRVLESYYAYNITQEEIACNLGVSQQSVSKTMKTTLDKLKDFYEREEKKNVYR